MSRGTHAIRLIVMELGRFIGPVFNGPTWVGVRGTDTSILP
jgi:hypothetical protein